MAPYKSNETSYDKMKELNEFDSSKMGVKGLFDSGITTIPKFFIHPPETLSDLNSFTTFASIPTIDLANVNSDHHRPLIVKRVKEAASAWGFFQVINHEVPVSAIDRTITAIKSFHEQPVDIKAKYYSQEESRGVMYASNNDLYRARSAAWHNSLSVWTSPEPPFEEELPVACRREVMEWDTHANHVAEVVMELLCLDLTVGITSHTDPGMVTVLLTNEVQGLQVRHGEGWVNVKPLPGGLIVNIGDLLQIVSNGVYKIVEHRVLANSSRQPRISVVMFFNLVKWKGDGYYGPLRTGAFDT
ncbi:hypothetical protein LguiB_034973 [Lonicera macranthoides]